MINFDWEDDLDKRVDKLVKNKFFLEAFYLYSAELESILQKAVEHQEDWVEVLLNKSKLKLIKNNQAKLKEKTLGELISLFARYCNNEMLISRLNDFNSFRKKIVHYLSRSPIEITNEQAKKRRISYYQLVSELHEYNIDILTKHNRRLRRKLRKSPL